MKHRILVARTRCHLSVLSPHWCVAEAGPGTDPPSPRSSSSSCDSQATSVCMFASTTKSPSVYRTPRPSSPEAMRTDVGFRPSSRAQIFSSSSLFFVSLYIHLFFPTACPIRMSPSLCQSACNQRSRIIVCICVYVVFTLHTYTHRRFCFSDYTLTDTIKEIYSLEQ